MKKTENMTENKSQKKWTLRAKFRTVKWMGHRKIGWQRPLVVTYCKDNLQVVEHVDFLGESFAAPPHQVVLTAPKSEIMI